MMILIITKYKNTSVRYYNHACFPQQHINLTIE